MERLFTLAVVLWCGAGGAGGAAGEQLSAAARRRSAGGGVYAQGFARRYEPALFVALPLHRPVPVLQLLTASAAAPQSPTASAAAPVPARTRPVAAAAHSPVYAASAPHAWLGQASRAPVAPQFHAHYPKTKPVHYKTTSTWYGNKQQSQSSSWYGEPSAADVSPAAGQYGQRVRARHPSPAAAAATAAAAPAAADYEDDLPELEAAPVVLYARPTELGGYEYRKRPAKPPKKVEPIIIRIHKHRVIRDD